MAATKRDISYWFDNGVENNHEFMIVVCDNYDYEDYPVYASSEDFAQKYKEYFGKNMQSVMEVYDLTMNKEDQMKEKRAFYFPRDFKHVEN